MPDPCCSCPACGGSLDQLLKWARLLDRSPAPTPMPNPTPFKRGIWAPWPVLRLEPLVPLVEMQCPRCRSQLTVGRDHPLAHA